MTDVRKSETVAYAPIESANNENRNTQSLGEFHTLANAIHGGKVTGREFEPGERIDRYEIRKLIGTGGFSNVYEVRHRYLEQIFALKTLKEARTSQEQAERFLREARTLALMSHPNVLRVYDANISIDGVPYIITERLAGTTLRAKVKDGTPMSALRVMDLLEEVAKVLILQEKMGIIHRDIKPSNIYERIDGRFCLFDYMATGLVADKSRQHEAFASGAEPISRAGFGPGTPLYMAPEQFEGYSTNQSDLYCLGMTAWECLMGHPPRSPDKTLAELAEVAQTPVPLQELHLRIPPEMTEMLRHLVATNPSDRYNNATEFLEDIQSYRYDERPPAGPLIGNCFIAIPYHKSFQSTHRAIARAVATAHLRPRRMDEITFTSDIWGQIEGEIRGSLMAVADFSRMGWKHQPNPNVITEAAHARAIHKPLIIITRDAPETLPFDWRHMPIVRYRNSRDGLLLLTETLAKKLRQVVSIETDKYRTQ